jgi:protein-S-isoprenylcysteine O-methyltransferase Ste14
MLKALAVAALALWPLIPIFFLQVHGNPSFWRKLGASTYSVVFLEMTPVFLAVIMFQNVLLGQELNVGLSAWLGALLMVSGIALNFWTGKLLGWKSLVGYSELRPQAGPGKPVTLGPFSVVRHPTYFAHTLIFVGVFLITGFIGTGVLALIDFLTSYFMIIPLEERELTARFGGDYRRYKKRVPRFFPVRLS